MPLLSLIFDKPKNTKINSVNEDGSERELLILDMTTNITHTNAANPTDNAIEDGAIIGDHVDIPPKMVSFEGLMSEAPITLIGALIGNVAGAIPAIGGFAGTAAGTLFTGALATLGGLLLNQSGSRVTDALNTMLQIQEDKIPVTLITGLRAYNNMILTQFNPTENANTGDSLRFTATFKEIKIVRSEQIILPASQLASGQVANSASSKQSKGKAPTSETTTRGSSFLSRLSGIGA